MASYPYIAHLIRMNVHFPELGEQLYLQIGNQDKIFAYWDIDEKMVLYVHHEMGKGYIKISELDRKMIDSVSLSDLVSTTEGILSKSEITNLDDRMINFFSFWFEREKEGLLLNIANTK